MTRPPFDECPAMTTLRQRTERLAKSDLPITVTGELGTGRRTLAAALVRLRSETFVKLDGENVAALRTSPARVDVLAHDLDLLPAGKQREVAALIHDKRIRLVAVASLSAPALAPELDAELSSTRLVLPPLRERPSDAIQWAELFVARSAGYSLTDDARRAVQGYRWPGNLIEIEASITRAVCLASGREISAADLGLGVDKDPVLKPLADAIEEFRAAYIQRALAMFDGNRTQAARALGIEPRTMFRYLEKQREG